MWPEHCHLSLCASALVLPGGLAFSLAVCGLAGTRLGSAAVGDTSTLLLLPLAQLSASPSRPHPVPLSFIAALLTLLQLSVQFSEHLQRVNHLSLLVGITQAFDLFDFRTSGNVEGLS